jgi:hypothetical protein
MIRSARWDALEAVGLANYSRRAAFSQLVLQKDSELNGPPFRPPDRLCHTQNLRMSDQDKKPEEQEAQAGTLLVCGATDWYSIGRTKEVRPEYPNLSVPHRLKALEVRGGRWAN